jgi:LEA14-like dessication related protein
LLPSRPAAICGTMKKILAPLFLATLLAFVAAGCGSNTTMVGLNVELGGISRGGGGQVEVTWRVANPNIVPYLVAQASHRIYLDGVLVGTINDKDALALPAQNKAERTSPLVLAGPAAERTVAAAIAAGSATYRLESTVTIRLYGDNTDKSDLRGAGTVTVTAK